MSAAKPKRSAKNDPEMVSFDWIVITTNLVGVAVVVIASIRAGSSGLVANVGSYLTSANLF